jgi:hypothetical protein
MKRIALLFFLMALSAGHAAGQQRVPVKNVAVVETELDAQSGAAGEISKAEVREITATLRREAVNYLPRGRYNVMTSETVQSMGGAVLEECAEENCIITLGSKIGADYIVRGIISKFQTRFSLTVELYETEYGNLVAVADAVRSGNLDELLEKSAAASADMYRKFVAAGTETTPELAPAPQTESASAPEPRPEFVKPKPAPERQKAPPPPQKPIQVTALADPPGNAIYIRWPSVPNAAGYKIYRRAPTADGAYTAYDSISAVTSPQFTHERPLAGAKYYYKVAAYNDRGTGPQSGAVSAIMPKPKPQRAATEKKPSKNTLGISLGVSAAGAGTIIYGIIEDGNVADRINHGKDENDYRQAENHAKKRNAAYVIGTAALLSGISIQIFF